jgi:hypothetical protein
MSGAVVAHVVLIAITSCKTSNAAASEDRRPRDMIRHGGFRLAVRRP